MTSRARLVGSSLKVGRFSFPAAAADREERGYRYVGRYAAAPVDILLVEDFDSIGWTIADQESGRKIDLPSLPIPSPDGRYWAASTSYPDPDGKVTIYERTSKAWRQVAVFKMEDACDLRWTGNGVLTVRDNTGLPFHKGMGPERRIVQTKDGWRLNP